MPYLIDSDVLTDYLAFDEFATAGIERLVPAGVAISVITYLETWQGTLRTADPAAAQRRHEEILSGVPVLPVTVEIARRCAELRHELQAAGKRVRPRAFDLLIAATALEHNLTLVTRNQRDYSDVHALNLAPE